MNVHVLSGVQTRNPKNKATTNLRLKPPGHRDRPYNILPSIYSRISILYIKVYVINITIQLLHADEVHKNCTRFVNDNSKTKY
jgi:hypothetical protein